MHVPFQWVWCLRQEPDVCNLVASVKKNFENVTGLREGHVPGVGGAQLRRACFPFSEPSLSHSPLRRVISNLPHIVGDKIV